VRMQLEHVFKNSPPADEMKKRSLLAVPDESVPRDGVCQCERTDRQRRLRRRTLGTI